MKKPAPQSTDQRAFVDARLVHQRLVSESISAAPGKPSPTPQQIQLRAEVGSNFSAGLNNAEKPTEMYVEAEFRVVLKLTEGDKEILSYLAKHTAHFKIVGWIGFDDWAIVPEGALGPYFAMTYEIAQKRAEHTLLDMGMRGVVLPRASNFDEYSPIPAGEIAAPAEVAKG